MEIRCFTISFAKGKAKEAKKRELIIKDEMDRLDHIICSNSDVLSLDKELKKYDNLKKELQQIYKSKGEAAKFRSKCMWAEKGERPTKYFFNLEKRNYSRKVISELEDDEWVITKEEEQIY